VGQDIRRRRRIRRIKCCVITVRMKWVIPIARVVEMISAYKIVITDPGLRDLGIDIMIILKSVLNK
jgi:hypothetical protein